MQEQWCDPSVRHNRLSPGQFQAGPGFPKPFDNESGLADDLDPVAQRSMESRDPERRDPCAFLSRQGFEPPSLDLSGRRIEIAPDLDRPRRAIGIPQYSAMRRCKTWVQNRKL